MLRNVVAHCPSKARRTKTFTAIFFPVQCSCSGKRPAKPGVSLNMSIALGLLSCHREKAAKGAVKQPGTDADSPPFRRATRRAISSLGGGALAART